MKRSLSFAILLFNWTVGFFLYFQFPSELDSSRIEQEQITISPVTGEVLEAFQVPEGFSIETEWKLPYLASFGNWSIFLGSSFDYLDPTSGYSSLPLFDVKKLFIHFFHTW